MQLEIEDLFGNLLGFIENVIEEDMVQPVA